MTPAKEKSRGRSAAPAALRLVASGRLQLLAMTGVTVCFLVTLVLAQWQSLSIDRNAREIAGRTAPSLQRLAQANVALRHYTFDALHYALEPPAKRPPVALDMRASRRELGAAVASYESLDNLPIEKTVESRLGGQIAALDAATAAMRRAADVGKGSPVGELLELRERANDVGFSIARLIDLGSQHGGDLAETITTARRRALAAELAIGGLSLLLALFATFFTVTLTRRSAAFFEARAAELERRSEELERFSSRVAHDVLGPLGNVGMALQLASRPAVLDERARKMLSRGMASLGRVTQLVDGLLEFALAGARPAPGAHSSVSDAISGLVEATADEARERSVEVHVDPLPADLPDVACHPGVLASLLGNLVRNAIKYMDGSGPRRISLHVVRAGERLRFEVADTGPGVPPSLAERLFEPYVRGPETGRPGLGLGLATVKRLAEAHGGAVGLSSTGRGSCFWFELPIAGPGPRPGAAPQPSAHPAA